MKRFIARLTLILVLCVSITKLASADTKVAISAPHQPDSVIALPPDGQSFSISPDGKWVSCWAWQNGNSPQALWMSSTQNVQWHRLATGTGYGDWRFDSKQYVFAASRDEKTSSLAVVSLPQRQVKWWRLPFYHLDRPAWSPDGRSVAAFGDQVLRYDKARHRLLPAQEAVGGGTYFGRLVLMDARGNLLRHRPSGLRLMRWNYDNPSSPRWSGDGRQIAYVRQNDQLSVGPVLTFDVKRNRLKPTDENPPEAGDIFWLGNRLVYDGVYYNSKYYEDKYYNDESYNGKYKVGSIYYLRKSASRGSFARVGKDSVFQSVLAVLPSRNNFYIVLQSNTSPSYSELWRGRLSPTLHLTKKLATFPSSEVFFEAKRNRLWAISSDSKRIRAVSLSGPFSILGHVAVRKRAKVEALPSLSKKPTDRPKAGY